jgi:hypothetical protein
MLINWKKNYFLKKFLDYSKYLQEMGNAFRTFGISLGGIEWTAVGQTVGGANLAGQVVGSRFVEIKTSHELLVITGDGVSVFNRTSFTNLFGVGVVLQIISVINAGLASVINVIADTSSITRNTFACGIFSIFGGDSHVISFSAGLALTSCGTDCTSVNAWTISALVIFI